MKRLSRIARIFLRLVQLLLGGVLLYTLAALGLGLIPVNEAVEPGRADHEVMLFSTGVHLDVCLPAQTEVCDWHQWLPPEDFGLEPEEARFISFGWGDSAFYVATPTWEQFDLKTSLRAVFTLTPSAMHVSYFSQPPTQQPDFVRVPVTRSQLASLTLYVQSTFYQETKGQPQRFRGSYYPPHPDAFYRANWPYHAFHTCNDWVNRGLRYAGIPAVFWTPVDRLILRRLRKAYP